MCGGIRVQHAGQCRSPLYARPRGGRFRRNPISRGNGRGEGGSVRGAAQLWAQADGQAVLSAHRGRRTFDACAERRERAGAQLLSPQGVADARLDACGGPRPVARSEEHTSELQSLMRISYAVFCLKKKTSQSYTQQTHITKTL